MNRRASDITTNARRLALMALGFTLVFVIGDQVLGRVAWADIYGTRNGSLWKWDLFNRCDRTPDVVFIGTSQTLFAVSPAVIDSAAARLTGRDVTSLNMSSAGASALTQYLLARRIVESGKLPRIVYLEIAPGSVDVSLVDWLASGLRALGEARDLPLAASVGGALFWETLRTCALRSYHRWDDVRLMVGRLAIGAPVNPNTKYQRSPKGWARRMGQIKTTRDVTNAGDYDPSGVRYAGLQANSVNTLALHRTIDLLEAAGVEARLLEIPVASIAAPWDRPAGNAPYQAVIQEVTAGRCNPIVRPPPDLVDDEDFFDPAHMNGSGAEKFSQWLSQDVAHALRRISLRRDDPAQRLKKLEDSQAGGDEDDRPAEDVG